MREHFPNPQPMIEMDWLRPCLRPFFGNMWNKLFHMYILARSWSKKSNQSNTLMLLKNGIQIDGEGEKSVISLQDVFLENDKWVYLFFKDLRVYVLLK